MYLGLRILRDRLETDTYSSSNADEIQTLLQDCCRTLENFQSTLDVYQSMPQNSRAQWDNVRSYEEFYGLKELRSNIQSNISRLTLLNKKIARCVKISLQFQPAAA